MMSLRWRMVLAFGLVILLMILLSVGITYWITQTELRQFTAEIEEVEAQNVAEILSFEYAAKRNLSESEEVLAELGYLYSKEYFEQLSVIFPAVENGEVIEFVDADALPIADLRVVVVDQDNIVVADNLFELNNEFFINDINAQRAEIVDLADPSLPIVGAVYVEFFDEYLGFEAGEFSRDVLRNTSLGGLVTGIVALLLGVWMSGRITAPVTALTEAAQLLTKRDDPDPLPVTSNDELGQMTAAFNQMIDGLKTQRHLRKRLINDVSHELNTPLSVIQLEATGMRDGMQTPDQAAEQIIQEVSLLRGLVHDLNWLAETDSGEVELNLEEDSVTELLTQEIERWQGPARAKQILLQLETADDLPTLSVDRMRMSQVIGNLINNAIQHSPVKSRVTVRAENRPIPMEEGRWTVISVQDEGPGIAADDLPHIFERFYRADEARSRQSGGRGLGLAIARQLVRLHGGYIWVDSRVGEGSTFFVALRKKDEGGRTRDEG